MTDTAGPYFVFGHRDYYPGGGFRDCRGIFDTLRDADAQVLQEMARLNRESIGDGGTVGIWTLDGLSVRRVFEWGQDAGSKVWTLEVDAERAAP